MRKDLNISFNLNHFYYHNDNYEWTNEMPYFWFSFFKIDGTSCKFNENLELEGTPTIYNPFNKIIGINNIEADKQDIIQIPKELGREEFTLTPISVPDFVKKTNIHDMESYIGCIVVLMNEDCALNDEKNIYAKILQATSQKYLNELIPLLNENQTIIDEHLIKLKENIEINIKTESKKNQSFWKRLTTENIINTTIWTFSSDELKSLRSASLAKYWGTEGIWELSGKVKVKENQTIKTKISEMKSRKKHQISVH
ncbi:hypothetical protein [Moheibacter sediminis]|uniref:Uncharacterized protein n=1 Tax=Moheibacter sediminis TaxID=1434700 RepID=A0A1W2AIT8_9FLAO|nr:hypothetical protein [Moheibacter sediminis]SMC60534.1 hypothetical protein SAMN06296427_104203 [Moheibacter sediminis]